MSRCERNLAGREEDCGWDVAYVPCGKPATHTILGNYGNPDWQACEAHTHEAVMDGCEVES